MNPSFGAVKTLDLFLNDFGASLAPMMPYFPERLPTSKADTATPRVAARLDGDHGFLFLNNHERTYHLPEHSNFQVKLDIPSGPLDVPRHPVTMPSDAYTIWPVNLDLGGVKLRYATAQLLCKLDDPRTYAFFAWPGIPAEFAVKDETDMLIEARTGQVTREGGTAYVQLEPGSNGVVRIRGRNNTWINILVLTREQAMNVWKAPLAGRERLILSRAQLYFDASVAHVATSDPSKLKAAIFPALNHVPSGFAGAGMDGIFTLYAANVEPVSGQAEVQPIRPAGKVPEIKISREVALVPGETAFDAAASCGFASRQQFRRRRRVFFCRSPIRGMLQDCMRMEGWSRIISTTGHHGRSGLITFLSQRGISCS